MRIAAADPRAELGVVDKQVYEALESVPARGWADPSVLRPLNDLNHELRNTAKGGEKEQRLLDGLPGRWSAIQDGFLKTLRLAPAATIAFDERGEPRAEPRQPAATACAGVPTAILLRVGPAPAAGTLTIAPTNAAGVRAPGQELRLLRHFSQVVAVPLSANGAPGPRAVVLKMDFAGKPFELPVSLDVRASGTLSGTVERIGGGGLAAKLFVEDAGGRLFVLPGEPNYRTQSWYAPWQPRCSYVEGRFELPLPPGKYRVTATKGYGWRDWAGSVTVEAGKAAACRIEMQPLGDLEADGWLCGDMHMHCSLGPTRRQMRAEDVNVAAKTLYSSHKSIPMPAWPRDSDATHLVTSNQEIEHWQFGNVFYYNIPRTVTDPPTPAPEHTPMFHYDEQAHALGGITLRWLRARPFSTTWHGQAQPELAVSAALGHMDVWTVLENSMQNLLDDPQRKWTGDGWGGRLYENTYRTWYALANCGLRVPAAAGTSYGRLSRLGFNRVYAKVGGKLSDAAWAAALKRGDGFVTNGPLLWLRAGRDEGKPDRLPGDGLDLDRPGKVALSVELISRHPVRLVEVLRNGRVIARKDLDAADAGKGLTWAVAADLAEPSWFAARCFGEHAPRYPHQAARNQFAHTNLLFVTIAGRRPASSADAARFVQEIDALIDHAPKLPTDDLRRRALETYRRARRRFADQAGRDVPLSS